MLFYFIENRDLRKIKKCIKDNKNTFVSLTRVKFVTQNVS